jgi:hypothetical protein
VRHREFCPRGAGWTPIIERAQRRLAELWPACPRPLWEEKFGDLCWKYCPPDAPDEVWQVLREAEQEAMFTCQYCPLPGRRRVVWTRDECYGWIQPWVKTCCDACSRVPQHLRDDEEYLCLVFEFEDQPADIH